MATSDAVEAMLSSSRAFVVAAAGCGKTELLGRFVAEPRSGRQLVLTHTHAGVAALRRRLAELRVPNGKFVLDTIAGWCLRYGAAYPHISGLRRSEEAAPDWAATYPGAEQVCRSNLGKQVVRASYDGVVVDEYQDCTAKQHALVSAIGSSLPCRAVGDPMQAIFGFRDEPVSWDSIRTDFDVLQELLCEPWRWRREGTNAALGEWLIRAREELATTGRLELATDAPVTWVRQEGYPHSECWATACRGSDTARESVVAILQWPSSCQELARRLGGRWPVVERFDDPDLLRLAARLVACDGPTAVECLVTFLAARMTAIGTDLGPVVDAIAAGRSTKRFTKYPVHAAALAAVADSPTPANILTWLDGVLTERDWWLYRRECVYQLRAALLECLHMPLAALPDAVAAARTRARHRGRHAHRRTVGTPLLVKGLEFDHAVLLWEPRHLSVEGLYVAITRAAKSLTIVSDSRTLVPAERWPRSGDARPLSPCKRQAEI